MKYKWSIFFCFISIVLVCLVNIKPVDICLSYDKNNKIKQVQTEKMYETKRFVDKNIKNNNEPKIIFKVNGKDIEVCNQKSITNSAIQNLFIEKGFCDQLKVMNFAVKNGFEISKAIEYSFPSVKQALDQIERTYCYSPVDAKVSTISNSAKLTYIDGQNGIKINKNAIYYDIFNKFNKISNFYNIEIKLENVPFNIDINKLKNSTKLKSEFKTYYGSSSPERKNNINVSLKKLDGIVINPGEILSFNDLTGIRNEKNGYQKAKIIKQGSFSQEYGGGVCQVSTTLYNCALLADLEIVEVNPHSLPVSYIEPSFDAMVNSGSSDLKIKNTTNMPIYIATCGDNEYCKICMYGVQNVYKIRKKSKKTHIFADFEKIETTDYKAYGLDQPLPENEKKIISVGKEGYESIGVLEYYIDDVLVKTKQIRKNKYNPTKQVVLVGG